MDKFNYKTVLQAPFILTSEGLADREGRVHLAGRDRHANRPQAAAAPGGGFFRRETWPVRKVRYSRYMFTPARSRLSLS